MKKFLKTTIFLLLSAVTIFAKEEPLKNKVIEGEKPQLKVMTYNIAAGTNNFKVDLKKTAETIKKINPDIIGIQEVNKLTERMNQIYAIDEHQLDIRGIKILGGDFNDTKESNAIKQLGVIWKV